jgi:hypothetical protein
MKAVRAAGAFAALAVLCLPVQAAMTAEELAKLAQNPVGNLISVPFQNNTNFNTGPLSGTQNILNIQPVIPIELNKDWNLITRTILPLIWQPEMLAGQGSTSGLGDIQLSGLLSPAAPGPGGLIWGAGAVMQMPTHTEDVLGNKNWGLGPTAVVLKLEKGSPWVYGALFNNVWSLSSDQRGGRYNNFLLQPFLNYNFPDGVYLTTSPVITANWDADSSQRWTVPLGGGIGKIFHFGKLPVNTQIGGYYNIVHADNGANWQLRLQVQFMLPK